MSALLGRPAHSEWDLVMEGYGTALALGHRWRPEPVPGCCMVPVPCAHLVGLPLDSFWGESGYFTCVLRSEGTSERPALSRQDLGNEDCRTVLAPGAPKFLLVMVFYHSHSNCKTLVCNFFEKSLIFPSQQKSGANSSSARNRTLWPLSFLYAGLQLPFYTSKRDVF